MSTTPDIAVPTGVDTGIRWQAPCALKPGTTPTLTVKHPTLGDVDVPLTPAVAPVVIDAIPKRRTLTAAANPIPGMTGAPGADDVAYLLTGDGPYRVEIRNVDGASVRLRKPFRSIPKVASDATLQNASWKATIKGADDQLADAVAAAAIRCPYEVQFVELSGVAAVEETRRVRGLFTAAGAPMHGPAAGTGLTSSQLERILPELKGQNPEQGSWSDLIGFGLSELRLHLFRARKDIGIGEDLIGAEHLINAHAYLTAAIYYQRNEGDYADALRVYAKELIEIAAPLVETVNGSVVNPGPQTTGPSVGAQYAEGSTRDRLAARWTDERGRR